MQIRTRHIAILCSRLDLPGGIERAVVNTANLFAEKGNTVSLVILDETAISFYPIHSSVQVIQQSLSFGITTQGNIISRKLRLLEDVLKLRKILTKLKPDVVISSEYPMTVALALGGAKKKSMIVSWEHHHFSWLKKNFFWNSLCKLAYPRLNKIVCLNVTEAVHFIKLAPVSIIPNFIENKMGQLSAGNSKTILSVGWLIGRKGIDFIMAAAKQVLNDHPDWKWKLIGDGEMKEQVLLFIEKEKLRDRFILQQPGPGIENEYLTSSLFVLASRYEAFPMVLLEAMSFGVPCISFDCPSGPADIIINDKNGLLVKRESITGLVKALSQLVDDEQLRKKMGKSAANSIDRFSPWVIYQLWEGEILSATKSKQVT